MPALLLKGLSYLGNPWVLLFVVLVLLAFSIEHGVALKNANEATESQLKASEDGRASCANSNASLNSELDVRVKQIAAMVDERKLDADKAAKVIADRDAALAQASQRVDDERRARDALWKKTQSCAGLAAVNIDDVCSDIADGLRQRAAGSR